MATTTVKKDIYGVEGIHYSNGVMVTFHNNKYIAITWNGSLFYSHPDKKVVMDYVEHLFVNLR